GQRVLERDREDAALELRQLVRILGPRRRREDHGARTAGEIVVDEVVPLRQEGATRHGVAVTRSEDRPRQSAGHEATPAKIRLHRYLLARIDVARFAAVEQQEAPARR